MSPGRIPDRPPRKRERPKWPEFLLIVGIVLTVAGFVLTFGPLAPDLGGTDSPPFDEPSGDSPAVDAGDENDETSNSNVNSDEGVTTEEIGETEDTSLRAMIGKMDPRDDGSAGSVDDERREKCVVE